MHGQVIPVGIKAIVPAGAGRAVFLGDDDKAFVIYIDRMVGDAITMFMNSTAKERPLTHDLIGHILAAFGAKVERVVINSLESGTYFARLILVAENEIMEKKIIELDARPSDSMAIAVAHQAPIYVAREVWDEVEDMSEVLQRLEEGTLTMEPDEDFGESGDTSDE